MKITYCNYVIYFSTISSSSMVCSRRFRCFKIDITDLNSSDSPSFTQRISVGYAFDKNFRLAVDYTNYGKVTANYADIVDVSLKGKSLGLTGFYDFDLADFKPYVGVRVSTCEADVTAFANVGLHRSFCNRNENRHWCISWCSI